jgi:hypothetical protein
MLGGERKNGGVEVRGYLYSEIERPDRPFGFWPTLDDSELIRYKIMVRRFTAYHSLLWRRC